MNSNISVYGSPAQYLGGNLTPACWGNNIWHKPFDILILSSVVSEVNFLINIYDNINRKIHTIEEGSDGFKSIKFSIDEHGCADFTMEHLYQQVKNPGSGTEMINLFGHGYRIEVYIGSMIEPWYNGYVTDCPEYTGIDDIYIIRGKGYIERLSHHRVTHHFQSETVHDIVDYIIKNYVEPEIYIVYIAENISSLATYLVNDIQIKRIITNDVMAQLATLAGNYIYGVNANREFYFKPFDVSIILNLWVGHHVIDCDYSSSSLKLANRLYIKCGEQTLDDEENKENYAGIVENTASQVVYGLFEDEVTAPSFMDNDDALIWGEYELATRKDPAKYLKINEVFNIDITSPIAADGNCRIIFLNGNSETLPIKKVTYSIDDKNALKCDLEIGDISPALNTALKEFAANLKKQELLASMNLAQS